MFVLIGETLINLEQILYIRTRGKEFKNNEFPWTIYFAGEKTLNISDRGYKSILEKMLMPLSEGMIIE